MCSKACLLGAVGAVGALTTAGAVAAWSCYQKKKRAQRVPMSEATLSPLIIKAEYAVRGKLVLKAMEYKKQLENKQGDLPFDEIVYCNIGNPHSLGQKPISFFRQVSALITCPELLEKPAVVAALPKDVVARARAYLAKIPGGTGAYTHSQGLEFAREEVARFIAARDGFPCETDDLFLTDGASPAVKLMLSLCLRNEHDGIMIPIPQYPLYSASIALFGGAQVGYYLDEEKGWGLSIAELQRSIDDARAKGICVRALVVINPGNPTGQSLPEETIREVIQFAAREGLVLMADEVYQENIYNQAFPFHSFKKCLRSMPAEIANAVPLASFHSISKGFLGECGRRGGYMEIVNFAKDVRAQIYKLASINLCSNIEGQIFCAMMCNPPKPGDESYELYVKERDAIMQSLKERAVLVVDRLNQMEGIHCNAADGAMYAFPSVTLPPKAVQAAAEAKEPADTFYCLQLLAQTGLVVVPGSGFCQRDGTYHFRTTILPPKEKLEKVLPKMAAFHAQFLAKYK